MEYVAERSQQHFLSFQTRKSSRFFVHRIMCVIAATLTAVFEELESEHHSNEWRLFTHSSKANLKAVMLNNGNKKPFISLLHATALKKKHKTTQLILRLINYAACKSNICGNLKVIGVLLGMQMGYTKNECFLCLWDSRDNEQHYIKKD